MFTPRFSTRSVLLACVTGIIGTMLAGGVVLGLVEGIGTWAGVWLAFNVVTTVGFGSGPESAAGHLVSIAAFWIAAVCWFGLVVVAVEAAMARFQRHSLIEEALRPMQRRTRNRLFTLN